MLRQSLQSPPKPAPYPSRYNGYQALFIAATVALFGLAILAGLYTQAGYFAYALAGFFIARQGLENPKPKEAKKL